MSVHVTEQIIPLTENNQPKRYVPITEMNETEVEKPKSQPQSHTMADSIESARKMTPKTKSNVLMIMNITLTITQELEQEVKVNIDTLPASLQDGVIPNIDITAKESIDFSDEEMTLSRLKYIIRRCGILEQYSEYFTNDPEIIINQYTLTFIKTYKHYEEFIEGVDTCISMLHFDN